MASPLVPIGSQEDLTAALADGRRGFLLFFATWQDASRPNGQLQQLIAALAAAPANAVIRFLICEAEAAPALARQFQVEVVPHFVALTAPDAVLEAFSGAEAPAVVAAVERLRGADAANGAPSGQDAALRQRLGTLVQAAPVMVFMKGVPSSPQCKFSRRLVELLQEQRVAFGSFDILTDEAVRQGLKTYSDWPTYPQVYCRGKLVGGLDVLEELAKEPGGLAAQMELGDEAAATNGAPPAEESSEPAPAEDLQARLRQLVSGSPAMLFMKGSPDAPRCGFSRRIVEILRTGGWDFGYFDILSDDEVRQGLKKFSDWPTFPQLYVKGDLVGGLDLVQEMQESGDLTDLKP